jgi:hypothetical protein
VQIVEATELLPTGHVVVSASFEREGDSMPAEGTLTLHAGEKEIGKGRIKTQPGKFSIAGEGLNVGKTARNQSPTITRAHGLQAGLTPFTRFLLVPCVPGPVTAPARKHGQGGTDGFLRGRHPALGRGTAPLCLMPVLVQAQEQFRGPALCVVHFSHHAGHAPRDPRDCGHCHAPLLSPTALCGRNSSIAVRPLAPNQANALISCPAPALGR